jgi:transglutaminase-like putative cysteine protease
MRALTFRHFIRTTLVLATMILITSTIKSQDDIRKLYMGIELNNVLCGYSEVWLKNSSKDQHPSLVIDQKTYFSFKALGRDISQKQFFSYKIDPKTGNFFYHDSYTEQGEHIMAATMEVEGDSIKITASQGEGTQKVYIPENAILPNILYYPYLQEDLGLGGADSKTYIMFDVRSGEVRETRYENAGREKLTLNDKEYDAVIASESNPVTGLKTKYWIDLESGLRLKMESQNNIRIYLDDKSVVNKVKTGNWDDNLFIKTNKQIKDIRGIASMKVQARLEAIPAASLEDLNVTGQTFKGKVSDNMISGEFEVDHDRYKGSNALPFGTANHFTENVKIYLKSEEMIESDHSEIMNLASEITKGSTDIWEAACRLSNWVAENMDGSIHGGSALETFRRGDGPCGSQSLLMAALCRAVGIPARVVWGCLYTPEYGGSFGHHGWNEVYMGESGWIPLDVTIHETDYVDSGHIRLGVLKTIATVINFKEMNILAYSLK